jgi:hypothetical protein
MDYEKQDFDFIKRTQSIIKQYEEYVMPSVKKDEQFDVTLFLNCFVGLLIVPQQNCFDNIPTDSIAPDEWGIAPKDIQIIKDNAGKKDEARNIKNVTRHLRNSIAHYHFKGLRSKEGNNQIETIEFEDFTDHTQKNQTFKAVISIAALKQFTTKFTKTMLEIMSLGNGK